MEGIYKQFKEEFIIMIKELMVYITMIPKIGYLGLIAAAIIAFLVPIAPIIHAMLGLVVIDMLTGISKSYREGEQKGFIKFIRTINSAGIGRTLNKFLSYLLLIIAAFILGKYILPFAAGIFAAKSLASLIGIREIVSIGENINQTGLIKEWISKINDKLMKG